MACSPAVVLHWIPLGAGQHVVRVSGAMYEGIMARVQRRPRCAIYHAALVVESVDGRFTVEMTPVPDAAGSTRGVVVEGPVGFRVLGGLRWFRYEIRRWRGGVIPDVEHAVSAITLGTTNEQAAAVLRAVSSVPALVWGRDEMGAGEMWNSNSVIAWVLQTGGVDASAISPPPGGRAPGWGAGVAVASDELSAAARPRRGARGHAGGSARRCRS